jgi:hypothetical protein
MLHPHAVIIKETIPLQTHIHASESIKANFESLAVNIAISDLRSSKICSVLMEIAIQWRIISFDIEGL